MKKQGMFINFTNHSSEKWDSAQREAANRFGVIRDMAFPDVDPQWNEEQVRALGDRCVQEILNLEPVAVLCQGEFTLSVYVIKRLGERGVKALAACAERRVVMEGNVKKSSFEFVQFREYI